MNAQKIFTAMIPALVALIAYDLFVKDLVSGFRS